jgi:hypothetical protein
MDLLQTADQVLRNWILKVTVGTLASIVIIVVIVLMIGVFLPNEQVDNKDIFAIIGPAFNTVIGAFVGLLGGMQIAKLGEDKKDKPTDPTPESPLPEAVQDAVEEVDDHIA